MRRSTGAYSAVTAPTFFALFALACALPRSANARVLLDVESCLDEEATRQTLTDTLKTRTLTVTVSEVRLVEGFAARLVVTNDAGEVLLERRFALSSADCPNAPPLLAQVLASFLSNLPDLYVRADPELREPESRVTIELREVTRLRLNLEMGVGARGLPAGADAELALTAIAGAPAHAVRAGARFRAGLPVAFAGGHVADTTMVLSVGYQTLVRSIAVACDLRAGFVWIGGIGYSVNDDGWLPWLEAAVSGVARVGPVHLGPTFTMSPMRHVVHAGQGRSRPVPMARVGLTIHVPLLTESD